MMARSAIWRAPRQAQRAFAPLSLRLQPRSAVPAGSYSSSAADEEQEEMHEAIRESVQALCK